MSHRSAGLGTLLCAVATSAAAQPMPTSQPKVVDIIREIEKPGHGAAHEATESRWADINRRAGYPNGYIALTAQSGPSEVWWITPFESLDALGKAGAFKSDDAAYTSSIARTSLEDGDHLTGTIRMQARSIPEASYGTFPDIGKARVYSVMTVRMRPGLEAAFAETAKHYAAMASGTSGIAGWRSYEVIAGAPGGTYLVIASFPSWAAVDANDAAFGNAIASGGAHLEAAAKLAKDAVMSTEVRYFTVNPRMSLVSKEMTAADRFWSPPKTLATAKKQVQ